MNLLFTEGEDSEDYDPHLTDTQADKLYYQLEVVIAEVTKSDVFIGVPDFKKLHPKDKVAADIADVLNSPLVIDTGLITMQQVFDNLEMAYEIAHYGDEPDDARKIEYLSWMLDHPQYFIFNGEKNEAIQIF